MFHDQSRNHSAPNRGTTPQGKGRGMEGKRNGSVVAHASLTYWSAAQPVDNPLAAASAAPRLQVACNAFGGDGRGSR